MMIRNLLILLVLTLAACSGGGSGGGDDSGSDSESLGGSKGIRILHAVLDNEPVRLEITGQGEITSSKFAEVKRYFSFGGDSQDLNVLRNLNNESAFSSSLTLDAGARTSLLFFGNNDSKGLKVKVLNDGAEEVPSGSVAVRVIHAADEASGVNFRIGTTGGDLDYAEVSDYLMIPFADVLRFTASRRADRLFMAELDLAVEEGKSYTIVVTGQVGIFTVAKLYQDF